MPMVGERLHGTDGIRGKISQNLDGKNPIEKLILQREFSPSLAYLIGLASGAVISESTGGSISSQEYKEGPLVVIGWDRRDGNAMIVDELEKGLSQAGCRTQRVGEVPTPGLHHCLLLLNADAGMMVTASHNPASDSGVKLFDCNGYKSMPEFEDVISMQAWGYSTESIDSPNECGEKLPPFDGMRAYRRHLKGWLQLISTTVGVSPDTLSDSACEQGLILDCSGGAATDWLSFGLTRRGLMCEEVSSRDKPINDNCGAGEFNSTDSWSNHELMEREQSHALLEEIGNRLRENDGMTPWSDGQLVAAALDGDGDRCLLLEATKKGIKIVDGDQMAFDWLNSLLGDDNDDLTLAHSIESDLFLPATCAKVGIDTTQTAIGDRWLSAALSANIGNAGQLIQQKLMPKLCGCEDSGHIVMPVPHPNKIDHWGLAGDGAATLLAQLYARAKLGENRTEIARGWKTRQPVKGTDRTLWDGKNELADEVVQLIEEALPAATLNRESIAGETSLLLLEGSIDGERLSIGIRNSGTEAKTSVTIKSENTPFDELATQLVNFLNERLVP